MCCGTIGKWEFHFGLNARFVSVRKRRERIIWFLCVGIQGFHWGGALDNVRVTHSLKHGHRREDKFLWIMCVLLVCRQKIWNRIGRIFLLGLYQCSMDSFRLEVGYFC